MLNYMDAYPHPGKYEGETLLVEHLDGGNGANDEMGDVETLGHFQFFDLSDWKDEEEGGTIDADTKAVILHTDNYGFVSASYFETVEEGKTAWEEIEAMYHEFDGAEEE